MGSRAITTPHHLMTVPLARLGTDEVGGGLFLAVCLGLSRLQKERGLTGGVEALARAEGDERRGAQDLSICVCVLPHRCSHWESTKPRAEDG